MPWRWTCSKYICAAIFFFRHHSFKRAEYRSTTRGLGLWIQSYRRRWLLHYTLLLAKLLYGKLSFLVEGDSCWHQDRINFTLFVYCCFSALPRATFRDLQTYCCGYPSNEQRWLFLFGFAVEASEPRDADYVFDVPVPTFLSAVPSHQSIPKS